jgi:microcystin-dependent protein
MALSNLIVKAIYQGNGTNTTFAIPFSPVVDDSSETVVIIRDEADPNDIQEIVQTEGSEQDYTLTGAPSLGEFHTDVEFNTAPTSDQKVYVARVLPLTQVLDLIKTGNFDPETIELALDRLTAMVQQTSERVDRSLLLQKTSGSFGNVLPPLNGNEGRVIAIAEDGSEFVFGPTMEAIEAAEGFAGAAEIAQGAAEDAQSSAEAAEASAEAAAAAGEEWALKAQEWAEKDEDVEVEDGKFSAKHHALKSEAAVADVVGDLGDHINDTSGAHAASAISNTPEGSLTATDVQSALNELQSDVDARATDEDLNSHTSSTEAHGAEGAVVGTTNTQTLTNKTFADPITVFEQELTPTTPSFGRQRIYAKEDGKWYTLDSDGIERPVGSGAGGSGQGGINHIDIDSANFETGVGGWQEYNNEEPTAEGAVPDGSPMGTALGISHNTSTPLRGLGSMRLTKGTGDKQGAGAGVAFDVDPIEAEKGIPQYVSFDYRTSALYASGDLLPFVIRRDTGALVNLKRSGTSNRFTGTFTPDTDYAEYYLCLHVATTGFDNWTVDVDNVTVGPAKILDTSDSGIVGSLAIVAMNEVPKRHLACDGSVVSRTEYSELFAAIGTTWGAGDGSTTFKLPDLETDGLFIRAANGSNPVGSVQGDTTAVNGLSTNTTGSTHTHKFEADYSTVSSPATTDGAGTIVAGSNAGLGRRSVTGSRVSVNDGVMAADSAHTHGMSGDAETRPKNAAFKVVIRYTNGGSALLTDAELMNESEVLSITSDSKTPPATSSTTYAMTNNSLMLKRGHRYLLLGDVTFSGTASSSWEFVRATWSLDNGNDTSSTVSAIPTSSADISRIAGAGEIIFNDNDDAIRDFTGSVPATVVDVHKDTEVFLVPRGNISGTAGDMSVQVRLTAVALPDLTVYGNLGTPFEVISAESNLITNIGGGGGQAGNNDYIEFVGNSLTLTDGIFELNGQCRATSQDSSNNFLGILTRWSQANGNNSSSAPSDIANNAGVELLTDYDLHVMRDEGGAIREYREPVPSIIIKVTGTVDVYLNMRLQFSSGTAHSARVFLNAKRLR